jgi:hypothetical protein
MASSNPNLNVHGISFTNNIFPTCARYDKSYNFNNVQPMHESGDLENPNFVVVGGQIVTIVHLENL